MSRKANPERSGWPSRIAAYQSRGSSRRRAAARASLQRQIALYSGMSYYRHFFDGTGCQSEMAAALHALEQGDAETASSVITPEMQDPVALVGAAEHCRTEMENRRSLGLQLPIVAPFAVGEHLTLYRQTIEELGQ